MKAEILLSGNSGNIEGIGRGRGAVTLDSKARRKSTDEETRITFTSISRGLLEDPRNRG